MAKKRATGAKRAGKVAAKEHPAAFYCIQSLLHTMRCIAQHEDRLCVLMNEIKSTGGVSVEVAHEIDRVLDELPSHEYTDDLSAVREVLGTSLAAPS